MTNRNDLLKAHDLFLIDAYGVLITGTGTLPGAAEFLEAIEAQGKSYFIVTNDASRTPETCARVYRDRGLSIPVEKILSAGLAISIAFEKHGLKNVSCAVLGTTETKKCVARAGGNVIELADPERSYKDHLDFDVLVVGDDSGFDFLPTMNLLLSSIHKMMRNGRTPKLFLANPDLLYPMGDGAYGYTSGSLAKLLEIGLKDLAPELPVNFEVLGKPAPLLFELALSRTNVDRSRTVMLGDQLHTDIAGARAAGIKSALLATGITQLPLPANLPKERTPDFILANLL